ncbi:MAG: hypothetical protein JOZ78_16525 [Chroococcidiopsidaceae cyanobacterium CP_BM_ER_R8_30]|nr:hypothetical protein [Chroococcidiopsidaceae cyanobacterium CP_BM_ER_R8_30]
MSNFETFFAFSFVSTAAVALLATWFRYLPVLIVTYRSLSYQLEQSAPKPDTEYFLRFKSTKKMA